MTCLVGAQLKCVLPHKTQVSTRYAHRKGEYHCCRTSTAHRFVPGPGSLRFCCNTCPVDALVYGSEYHCALPFEYLSLTVPTDRCHINRPDGLGLKALGES